MVIDGQTFPRDKVCAGWITPPVVDLLDFDADAYRNGGRVMQPITSFRTGLIGGGSTVIDYGEAVSHAIRRFEFDHYLLAGSGVRLRLGEPVKKIERQTGGWLVNGTIRTPLIVGAGGHSCPVARLLGANPGRGEAAVVAQEVEFELDAARQQECRVSGAMAELYFCRDLAGYGWCVRKGNHLNIGLGRQPGYGVASHVEGFVRWLQQEKRIPTRKIPAKMHGHAYLLYDAPGRTLIDDGVLLIGDAAGLACHESGEGIRAAVESGLLAASVILDAGGDYRRSQIEDYPRQLEACLGRRSRSVERRRKVPEWISSSLLGMPWFARHMLLDRWFLRRHQKPLRLGSPR